jgi:hypothetical protein
MRQDYRYQAVSDEPVRSSKSIKKSTGSYYTPGHLANLITQDTIFKWLSERVSTTLRNIEDLDNLSSNKRYTLLNNVKCLTILDPAVGEGAFLLAAANWLRKIRVSLGDYESENNRKQSIVSDCLFGVDLSQGAIISCKNKISNWVNGEEKSNTKMNIRYGNSLFGYVKIPADQVTLSGDELDTFLHRKIHPRSSEKISNINYAAKPFHWGLEFQNVFLSENPGFDIIIGNPPYGSILGPIERPFIATMYPHNVGGGKIGTWNSAAHFLVRATSLMKEGAHLGFLVPNSFLRVKQFSKIREFLLNHTQLWKIVDEGSPFEDVTLEMVSLYCGMNESDGEHKISVESRRHGFERSNVLSSKVLKEGRVFSIYHDHIFSKILKKGQRGLLLAGRGRDIPKEHVSKKQTSKFKIPYITSGRSVQRYGLKTQHISYTDEWFLQNSALKDSFESEFLVATKNYRYPRCIMKPKGMIHGGGIVKINPLEDNVDLRALGLILNSRLVQKISIRYLTNYSQLTCCLNTGIMEDLPLVLPKNPKMYGNLFDVLSHLHSNQEEKISKSYIPALDRMADALVYSLYFGDDGFEQQVSKRGSDLYVTAQEPDIVKRINEILRNPVVKELEQLCDFPPTRKSRRY